jgi:(2Fe-2S) ferredoxin
VDCLRICRDGPICVVYPEGTWYRNATPPVLERILVEHVLGGKPVEEHVFARSPLVPTRGPDGPGTLGRETRVDDA